MLILLERLRVYLPDNIQKLLRENGLINENEVVLKEGDLYVALNVLTKNRRSVNVPTTLIEKQVGAPANGKRVLKG